MTSFSIRYDLRRPDFATASAAELYAAALEQCAWADERGFAAVTLSEHHGSPDGYLPSPLCFASAVAARTQQLRISIGALIAPLHDFLRIAEDLAVVDVLSKGRLVTIVSGGYVASEFASFGRRLDERARLMEEVVPFLRQAWTGEPFEWRGRRVRVTPRPVQRPQPPILMGGASRAAARRAARLADGFVPTLPELHDVYRAELRALGKRDPGPPAPSLRAVFVHVAEDPERAWARIAPHALHETNAYGRWIAESGDPGPYQTAADAEALRRSGNYLVLTPGELVERLRALGPAAGCSLHPLMGGLDPELGWESLELVAAKVMPALR